MARNPPKVPPRHLATRFRSWTGQISVSQPKCKRPTPMAAPGGPDPGAPCNATTELQTAQMLAPPRELDRPDFRPTEAGEISYTQPAPQIWTGQIFVLQKAGQPPTRNPAAERARHRRPVRRKLRRNCSVAAVYVLVLYSPDDSCMPYCGRRSTRCGCAYSLRPPRHSAQLCLRALRARWKLRSRETSRPVALIPPLRAPSHSGVSSPSLRAFMNNPG